MTIQILIPEESEIIVALADCAVIPNRLCFPIKNLAYYFLSDAAAACSLDFILPLSREDRTDFCRNLGNRRFILDVRQAVLSRYGIRLVWFSIRLLYLLHAIQNLSQSGSPVLSLGRGRRVLGACGCQEDENCQPGMRPHKCSSNTLSCLSENLPSRWFERQATAHRPPHRANVLRGNISAS